MQNNAYRDKMVALSLCLNVCLGVCVGDNHAMAGEIAGRHKNVIYLETTRHLSRS